MRKKTLILIIILASMTGCSAHKPTQLEVTANHDIEQAISVCQQQQANLARSDAVIISSVPLDRRDTIALMYLMNKHNVEVVAAATGHSIDPCRQTNLFDSQIAEVKEKTRQVKEGTGILRSGIPWVVGGLTVNALADKAGAGVVNNLSATENGKINVHSQNSGSENYVGNDYQNNGTNTIDNSTCDNCDTTESVGAGPDIDTMTCKSDADCVEGQSCSNSKVCIESASIQPVEPGVGLEDCLRDPPAGYNLSGTPLWTPGCSCGSHWGGRC